MFLAPQFTLDPWAQLPRRAMTNMLRVATGQFGDPVAMLILVEAEDLPRSSMLHTASRSRCRIPANPAELRRELR
jgi:hypothetical protein